MTATTLAKTFSKANQYPANCVRCGARIDAGEGLLAKTDQGKWAADHPADCPPVAPAIMSSSAPTPAFTAATEGIYRDPNTGTIYKVQVAKQGSGNLYAKRLMVTQAGTCGGCMFCDGEDTCPDYVGNFEYAPGVVKALRPEWKLTVEEAAEFGALYGICGCCGRDLTDEESIARGIGPICFAKYF